MPYRFFAPKDNSRSPILSLKSLFIANLILLLIVGGRIVSLHHKDLNILGFATDINVEDLFLETNQKRQQNGLSSLEYSPILSRAAEKKANDMFEDDYWAHIAPDGREPWDFIKSEGYVYRFAGENLAKDFNKSSSVVDAWMNSPTHRENILNGNYSQIGFAVVDGNLEGKKTTLVVQMFGTPQVDTDVSEDQVAQNNPTQQEISQVEESNPTEINEVAPSEEVEQGSTSKKPSEKTSEEPGLDVVETDYKNPEPGNSNEEYIKIDVKFLSYFSYILLGLFSIALVFDGYIAFRNKHTRITGNTISHLIAFIISLVFIYYLNNPGIL